MKLKKLNLSMTTVVLLFFLSLQTVAQVNENVDTIPPSTGEVTEVKVSVPISAIRTANIKLIEHKHFQDIIKQQDSIISNQKRIIDINNIMINNYKNSINNINNDNNKLRKKNTFLLGVSVTSVLVSVLSFIIK